MDIGLFAKSQSLSLISFPPPSPSPSSSRIRTLRREFLGCGHNLRPPGLFSLRRCSKLGLHCRSHRFLVRASLDAQSVVLVVSVVTLSVLTVVFLNYSQRKKNSGKEVLGQLSLALSQQVQGILNRLIKNQSLAVLDLERLITAHERKDAPKEVLERIYESEDEIVKPQLKETALMPEGTLIIDTVDIPSYVTSSVTGSLSLGESDVTDPSFPLPMPSEPGIDEHKGPICELNEVGEIISHSGIFTEPRREGLYAFYEANHSQAESILNLNGPKTLSSQTSQQNYYGFSSLKRKSVTGVNLLAKSSIHTEEDRFVSSESTEGKIPIAYFKKGPSHKSADLAKSKGIAKENESRILPQDGRKYSPQPAHPNGIHVNGHRYTSQPSHPNGIHVNGHRYTSQPSHPNGMHANDKHYPSRQIPVYNNLLKAGRLIDCLELLEGTERKGLLDMDKVYHVGFFKSCQKQRAVKEAFRFTKLIPNPTLSTFNMLMSVCASSQDSEGAFEVMQLVQEAGLKSDCKLYTTLISTCAKSGKVDAMFKVFHEMVNAEVEPNVHTYGALIDGCARAGQVAKAFGAYGIMRSKNVKPDRVIFNALITACGQSGAVDRAFDVLAEMTTETQPIDPDHITVGALMKACANAGQVDRARETYNMIHKYNIKGTPEVYTIAVNSCSQTADWEFACSVYSDMTRKGVITDETFLSAMIDVAGHAGKVDAAFGIIQEARKHGMHLGTISYSSLMGACSNVCPIS